MLNGQLVSKEAVELYIGERRRFISSRMAAVDDPPRPITTDCRSGDKSRDIIIQLQLVCARAFARTRARVHICALRPLDESRPRRVQDETAQRTATVDGFGHKKDASDLSPNPIHNVNLYFEHGPNLRSSVRAVNLISKQRIFFLQDYPSPSVRRSRRCR